METWQTIGNLFDNQVINLEEIKKRAGQDNLPVRIYPQSIHQAGGSIFFLARNGQEKKLIIYRESSLFQQFQGIEIDCGQGKAKVCDLHNDNSKLIRRIFPFTNPSSHQGFDITIGLGDRLGLASAGHLRLIEGKKVFPVLAQQSMRELNLTGRTYEDVIAAAAWAVFQEGYTSGFGADGDHLKTMAEVKLALDVGMTMITLDCSEQIHNEVPSLNSNQIAERYSAIPEPERKVLESKYLIQKHQLKDGSFITFAEPDLQKIVLIYYQAIKYTIDIYQQAIQNCGRTIDFEMSIDETLTSTTPESHYFVASELIAGGVKITSLAPRFCGEFQKGIDYIGVPDLFLNEFRIHVQIAKTFGYKISIHSGSDKFRVFPIIGVIACGKYHLKTAGTNWLEAVRVIARKSPALYRRMHQFALENLSEAKKYYHISADPANIPSLADLSDQELPSLMDHKDARQVLHITYGLILSAENPDGSRIFKDEIYQLLNQYENDYYEALEKHIGRHLDLLDVR